MRCGDSRSMMAKMASEWLASLEAHMQWKIVMDRTR